jgi:hypothetical protein
MGLQPQRTRRTISALVRYIFYPETFPSDHDNLQRSDLLISALLALQSLLRDQEDVSHRLGPAKDNPKNMQSDRTIFLDFERTL